MLSAKHLLDILLESNQPFNINCPWRIDVRSQSLKLRLNCWFCCKEFTKLPLFQFFQTQKRKNKNSRTTCNKHYPGSSDVLGGNWSYRKQSKYFNYLHLAGYFLLPSKTYFVSQLSISFQYVCMSMAILLHYFLLTMFSWMLVEGFHLYILLVQVFKTNRNFRKYLAFGWGNFLSLYITLHITLWIKSTCFSNTSNYVIGRN